MMREPLIQALFEAAGRFEPALVMVPPCCNHPDVAQAIATRLRAALPPRVLLAYLSVDLCKDEDELCDLIIRTCLQGRPELAARWGEEDCSDLSATMRLKAFGGVLERYGVKMLLVLAKFEHLFLHFSSPLLGALRDLEAVDQAACINVSSLDYRWLTEIRTKREPSFVSDYGQGHPLHKVGAWSEKDARAHWEEKLEQLEDDPALDRYFDVAFDLTGGIPVAMQVAERVVPRHVFPVDGVQRLRGDVRPFRNEILDQLPRALARVLDDEREDKALARTVLEVARDQERSEGALAILRSHPWADVLLADSRDRLRTMALAPAAELAGAPLPAAGDGRVLYARGEFQRCLEACRSEESSLALVAEAMMLVFPRGEHDLYFAAETKWSLVRAKLRRVAESERLSTAAKLEAERWIRVADAFERHRDGQALSAWETSGARLPATAVEDALIVLGARALAVSRDPNFVTATHVSVPLIEDVVRHYLVLVEDTRPRGSAFERFAPEAVRRWWPFDHEFRTPPSEERLAGTSLVVAAALVSERAGRPLFENRDDLRDILNALGATRNRVSHHVVQPGRKDATRLATPAVKLLTRFSVITRRGPSPDDLRLWLAPPHGVLE